MNSSLLNYKCIFIGRNVVVHQYVTVERCHATFTNSIPYILKEVTPIVIFTNSLKSVQIRSDVLLQKIGSILRNGLVSLSPTPFSRLLRQAGGTVDLFYPRSTGVVKHFDSFLMYG